MKGDHQLYHAHFRNITFINNYPLTSSSLFDNSTRKWGNYLVNAKTPNESPRGPRVLRKIKLPLFDMM